MKTKMVSREKAVWALIALGCFTVGLVLGYMLAMQGVYELLNHVQFEQFTFSFNQTEFADYILEKCQEGKC